MVAFNFANFFKTTVTAGYGTGDTSITVSTVSGAPEDPWRGTWYNKTDYLDPTDDPNAEVVEVTSSAASPITVARGAEGTAKTHNASGKTYEIINCVSHETLYAMTQTYNIMAFGAKGDGVTDDGAAIQAAIDRASTDGGGIVYIPPGTFLIDAYQYSAQHSHFQIKSNIAIVGAGHSSIIKVADGVMPQIAGPPYWYGVFYQSGTASNVLFRDFKIDFNGDNNTVASGVTAGMYAYGIGIANGSNIIVQNMWFYDHPGRQIVNLGNNATPGSVTDVNIRDNLFQDVGTGAAAGTNQYQTDHSTLYLAVYRASVERNIFQHRLPTAWNFSTAVETHGRDIVCRGNQIDLYDRGFNISGQTAPGDRTIVSHNIVTDCRSAVYIWTDGTYGMDGFIFSDNICTQKDLSSFGKGYQMFISFENVNTATPIDNVIISGNQFISNWQEPAEATLGHGIHLEYCKHVTIKDNVFKNLNGRVATQGSLNANEMYLTISGNTIIDCCQTNNASFKEAIGLLLSTTAVKRIVIERNIIENTSTVYMTKGIRLNMNVDTCRVRSNTIRNVTTHGDFAGESEMPFTDTIIEDVIIMESITTGATPSVGNGAEWYWLAYPGSQNVTDFSDSYNGQEIALLAFNGNATIKHGSGVIELQGSVDFAMNTVGDALYLKMRDGVWYEVSRRQP
jgi:hypothetical protein